MKLNLTKEQAIYSRDTNNQYADGGSGETWSLAQDWLTLENECTKRGKLIEELERALRDGIYFYDNKTCLNHCIACYCKRGEDHQGWCFVNIALSTVSKWRKEQK